MCYYLVNLVMELVGRSGKSENLPVIYQKIGLSREPKAQHSGGVCVWWVLMRPLVSPNLTARIHTPITFFTVGSFTVPSKKHLPSGVLFAGLSPFTKKNDILSILTSSGYFA